MRRLELSSLVHVLIRTRVNAVKPLPQVCAARIRDKRGAQSNASCGRTGVLYGLRTGGACHTRGVAQRIATVPSHWTSTKAARAIAPTSSTRSMLYSRTSHLRMRSYGSSLSTFMAGAPFSCGTRTRNGQQSGCLLVSNLISYIRDAEVTGSNPVSPTIPSTAATNGQSGRLAPGLLYGKTRNSGGTRAGRRGLRGACRGCPSCAFLQTRWPRNVPRLGA